VNTVLKKLFIQRKFDTDSSEDPILALENFKDGSYGLILLDIKRPEMDGFHLYQER
jgi:DNA-binding response OmpR family regulator